MYRELSERIATGVQFLADKPEENADSTTRALWHAAAGEPKSVVAATATAELPPLDAVAIERLETLVARRLDGVPLAHLTGRQHFMGLEMLAGPEALVPRVETELLARAAIDCALELGAGALSIRVVDLCTGSGNVALAIAAHVANAQVFGADLDASAVALAQRNAQHLGLDGRAQFRAGDLLAPFDTPPFLGQVDLLTCNPPYISSAKVGQMAQEISAHEPRMAFDGGPLGISILLRLIEEAPRFLRSGGWLAFEVGLGQGASVVRRLQKDASFREVRAVDDHAGAVRAVLARR
jgi:release factor glutamine methyltransferase